MQHGYRKQHGFTQSSLSFVLKITAIVVVEFFLATSFDLAHAQYVAPSAIRNASDGSNYLRGLNMHQEQQRRQQLKKQREQHAANRNRVFGGLTQQSLSNRLNILGSESLQQFEEMRAVAERAAQTLNDALRELTSYVEPDKDGVGVRYYRLGRIERLENVYEEGQDGSPYRRTVTFDYVDDNDPNSEIRSYTEIRQDVHTDESGQEYLSGLYSSTDWSGAYDADGRLISFTRVDQDAYGESSETRWEAMIYDNLGNPITTDEDGNKVDYFDTNGNVLGYTETVTDSSGNTTTTVRSPFYTTYDDQNRLTSFLDIHTDEYGHQTQTHMTAMNYVAYDDLGHYESEITDLDTMQTEHVVYDATYMSQQDGVTGGRVLESREVRTNDRGERTTTIWESQGARYDEYGNALSYIQKIIHADGSYQTEIWDNGQFHHGNLLSYNSERRLYNPLGQLLELEKVLSYQALYDGRDNLIDYTRESQITTYRDVVEENLLDYLWEDFSQTMAGLDLDGQRQFLISQGVAISDDEWSVIDQDVWDQQTLHDRISQFVDDVAQLPEWSVIAQSVWDSYTLDQRRERLASTEFAIDDVTWTNLDAVEREALLDERKNSYVEQQQMLILDQVLETYRARERRALIDRKTVEYATAVLQRTDAVISSRLWEQLSDAQKQVFLTARSIDVADNFFSLSAQEQFEALPRQHRGEYQEQDHVTLISNITERWHKAKYSDNDLLLYNEQVVDRNVYRQVGDQQEHIREAHEVNIRDAQMSDAYVRGRLQHYTDYNYVEQRNRESNEVNSSFSQNETRVLEFNARGAATSFETQTRSIRDLYSRDEVSQAIENLLVNDIYELAKFVNNISERDFRELFAGFDFMNQQYASYSRHSSFLTAVEEDNAVLQALQQEIATRGLPGSLQFQFAEIMDTLSFANFPGFAGAMSAVTSTEESTFVRNNITYNEDNRVMGYHEQGTNTDGQSYETDMYEMEYDGRGNLREYRNSTNVEGARTDVHRFNMTYDAQDRAFGYTEEIYSQGDFSIVQMRQMDYDYAQRLSGFERFVLDESGQQVSWERQNDIRYDNQDNVLSYDARRISGGQELADIHWQAVALDADGNVVDGPLYNQDGQMMGFRETGVDVATQRRYEVASGGYQYAQAAEKADRGVIAYTTYRTEYDNQNAVLEQETIRWNAQADAQGSYYNRGQVLSYQEVSDHSVNGQRRTEVQNSYDANGHRTGVATTNRFYNINGIENRVETTQWNGTYNTDGLLLSSQSLSAVNGVAVDTISYTGESLEQYVMALQQGVQAIDLRYLLNDINGDQHVDQADVQLFQQSFYQDLLSSIASGSVTLDQLQQAVQTLVSDDSFYRNNLLERIGQMRSGLINSSQHGDVINDILTYLVKDTNADH